MRLTFVITLMAFGLLVPKTLKAQSTISDRAWELTAAQGLWGVFLPDYELGSAGGSPAFHDDLDDVGYFAELKLVRRFLGTRTSFETSAFFGLADSSSDGALTNISVPNPATGAATPFAGARPRLESDVDHYGVDVTLRDIWRTPIGGLAAGCAFSYMAFDQNFDADYGAVQLMREDLNSDFLGGKAVLGWDGCVRGRPSNLDVMIGYYNLDADYRFIGQAVAGADTQSFSRHSTTIETYFTTRTNVRGFQVGWKIGLMYLSDMPVIRHTPAQRAALETDEALTVSGMIELLL